MSTSQSTSSTYVLDSAGTEYTASIQTGKHDGPCLIVRDLYGTLLLAAKIDDATPALLAHWFDPGTVHTLTTLTQEA